MHEWMFRSGLDHYATWFGMFTAYHFESFKRLTDHLRSPLLRLCTVAVCGYDQELVLWGDVNRQSKDTSEFVAVAGR